MSASSLHPKSGAAAHSRGRADASVLTDGVHESVPMSASGEMTTLSVWGYPVPRAWLSEVEANYLNSLPKTLPSLEWVWKEMDRVWRELGLVNRRPLDTQPIGEFYSHPVWLMNGIFTVLDPASASNRDAIARYVYRIGATSVADYGGGFGALAQAIARTLPKAKLSIIEPYPSNVALNRLQGEARIQYVANLGSGVYDVIVGEDVLEHVEDPVGLACHIAAAVREGGVVIFANSFYPWIQCHLPSTFHLRYSFPLVMRAYGMRYLGSVEGVPDAQIFERSGPLNRSGARRVEHVSRLVGPVFNFARGKLGRLKRRLGG